MGYILAIDPGNDTGWAFFLNGQLFGCGLAKPDALPILAGMPSTSWGKLVIERPEVYPDERNNYQKVNNLITLAVKVGYASSFYEQRGATVTHVLPKVWKKQVPKDVHEGRIKNSLTLYEKGLAEVRLSYVAESKRHNVWDAIGLGIWFAKAERERL